MLPRLPLSPARRISRTVYGYLWHIDCSTGIDAKYFLKTLAIISDSQFQRAEASELFDCLARRETKSTHPGASITVKDFFGKRELGKDIEAIRIVRDIYEELQIMISILKKQYSALHDIEYWKHWGSWKKDLDRGKEALEALSQQAIDVDEMVSRTLMVLVWYAASKANFN